MKRSGTRVALLVGAGGILCIVIAVVGVCVVGFIYLSKDQGVYAPKETGGCRIKHVHFDPNRPESAKGASLDQQAILAINGPPQAFTLYIDPGSGSVIEEWDYFTLGEELIFLDGVFQGGLEVPLPNIDTSGSIPEPAVYPWEIIEEFTPLCAVELGGTALFDTSALVLPGWNDDYEVARLWMLARGGSMVTVDGRLVLLSIDPGEAIDLDEFQVTNFFVGTIGEGNNRLGAILSPGGSNGAYRLSLSPRGQGTTQDGVEIVLDLEGSQLDREFVFGTDAMASVVDYGGVESPAQARGTVTITRQGDNYEVRIDGRIDNQNYAISGTLGNGFWTRGDRSPALALGEARPPGERKTPGLPPPVSQFTPPPSANTPAIPKEEPGWRLIFEDTFDSNANKWPVTWSTENEFVYFQSDLFDKQYLVYAERRKGVRPYIERWIDFDVGPQFQISVEARHEGGSNADCGLMVATKDGTNRIGFMVSAVDGEFRAIRSSGSGDWYEILSRTPSTTIRPGKFNHLSLVGNTSGLTFFINDQQVGTVDIAGIDVRRFGLAVSTGSDEPTICIFDNVIVHTK
jgi:hypothetical protein